MGKFFNWPPFVTVPIDANTGKPLDPNVGMRVQREFYNVGKDGKGKKVMIAHKSGSAVAEKGKKEDGGKVQGKHGGAEKKGDATDAGGGEKASSLHISYSLSFVFLVLCFTYNILTTCLPRRKKQVHPSPTKTMPPSSV